ncbi:hypothetical protein [Gordonia alkaliphila]|uniref:Protein kinase domain-containing protein n=1 Tax=Gordonia alkaliphila TaxID=1053547 RepID=A0ABP8ZJZ5_9ACTN
MRRYDKSDLGRLVKVDDGGQAQLYSAPLFCHPEVTGQVLYKEYERKVLDRFGSALNNGLSTLVAYPDSLNPQQRTGLLARTIWPKAVIVDGKQVVGLIMGKANPAFWFESDGEELLFNLKKLLASPKHIERQTLTVPSLRERALLARQLITALHHVHRNNLVVGDVSGNNIVVTNPNRVPDGLPGGAYQVKFLDVDSFRFQHGSPPVPQGDTPTWELPESLQLDVEIAAASGLQRDSLVARQRLRTQATDIYKMGLVMVRLFDETDDAPLMYEPINARPRMVAAFGEPLTKLLLMMLDEVPERRPTSEYLVQNWSRFGGAA